MIEIFILSIIQGVAEFLPVSSSSHLILISDFLSFENQKLSIDVSLHIGSFIAVIFYFYKDIANFYLNRILFFNVLIASIPVMITGFFLVETNLIEKMRNIETIAWTTIIFGILLYLSDKFKLEKSINKLNLNSAVFIGIFQIFSLIPGVSRSGIAITAARLLKFKRVDAAKISFLLSIPILGAISIFGVKNIVFSQSYNFTKTNLLAILLAFIFSYITIKYFLKFIKRFNLSFFVIYRIILGSILLAIIYL